MQRFVSGLIAVATVLIASPSLAVIEIGYDGRGDYAKAREAAIAAGKSASPATVANEGVDPASAASTSFPAGAPQGDPLTAGDGAPPGGASSAGDASAEAAPAKKTKKPRSDNDLHSDKQSSKTSKTDSSKDSSADGENKKKNDSDNNNNNGIMIIDGKIKRL